MKNFKPSVTMPSGPPIQVTRFTGASRRTLPLASEITALGSITSYTNFTAALEDYHNDFHSWTGGQSGAGKVETMSDIMRSPADPLFWMHHAQIDRIWSIWQQNHTGTP